MDVKKIKTLGDLKKSSYQYKSVKEEVSDNLKNRLSTGQNTFDGIWGYEDSVIPNIERAILSKHNILLLGLRGQAKTRIARSFVDLLDEYVPVIKNSVLNEHPLRPIGEEAKMMIDREKDKTAIEWLHRSERYSEKLATPDVSVADLIGDLDPIKAANQKLSYSDIGAIHYGIIPRSNRGIFCINELPDLQSRIQVSLFNILEEGDIQIRGFKLRLPLDMVFVFTANPEDYTNRGSIVTPLKDRIESQILTHYPKSREISKRITEQEAKIEPSIEKFVHVPELAKDFIEEIAIEARNNEFVDEKSGVSARLTITAYENLLSTAFRRGLLNQEKKTCVRVSDFVGIIPAITGKIELVYEGEQEGHQMVAENLMEKTFRKIFKSYFPEVGGKKSKNKPPYQLVVDWFETGQKLDLLNHEKESDRKKQLKSVSGLMKLAKECYESTEEDDLLFFMEFCLHGLASHSLINKSSLQNAFAFNDLMSGMLSLEGFEE